MRWMLVLVAACGSSRDREVPPTGTGRPAAAAAAAAAKPEPIGRPRHVVTIESLTKWSGFGRVFAADRDLIAAPDQAADRRTVVRVMRITGATRVDEATLETPPEEERWFATGVGLDGNILAVTASEAILLYRGDAGRWSLVDRVPLTGESACGNNFPEYVAIRGETVVVGSQTDDACVYEHRDRAWVKVAAPTAEQGPHDGPPFAFDGKHLALARYHAQVVDIYAQPTWAKVATIAADPRRDWRFAGAAAIDRDLVAVGLTAEVDLYELATPPRRIVTLTPQSDTDVPMLGTKIALAGPRLAMLEHDGAHVYARVGDQWESRGAVAPVRAIGLFGRIAIANLLWIGESNESKPDSGALQGYRWE